MDRIKNFCELFLIVTVASFIFSEVSSEKSPKNRVSSVTTPFLIKKHGYPVEEHTVQTSDAYVLTMHRIPYSTKTGKPQQPAPVAFLMHGLLCSSSDWILNGPQSGLAYILSDAGYDVWMGNARGNTYSKKHAEKSPHFQPFWNFEWHQIGIYDLPAMIDYVLYKTKQKDLRYFGHSQGTTSFFVLTSMIPRFQNRIRSAHLMAPVAFMSNMQSPLVKVGAPLLGQPNVFNELFGSVEFLPSTRGMELLGSIACANSSKVQAVCTNSLFLIMGWNSPYLNESMIPLIMSTTPAGASINQIQHYLQEYNSGYFRQFDYGALRNKKKYGNRHPPQYKIENIDVPTFLYYGDNDYMASVIDVHRLIRILKPNTMKRAHKMPPGWNHVDFLWGLDVKRHLYDVIMNDIESS